MEDNYSLSNCNKHDVLLFGSTTLKVNQLGEEVSAHFSKVKLGQQIHQSLAGNKHLNIQLPGKNVDGKPRPDYEVWFDDGIDCEILKIEAKGWQKGKVKVNLTVRLEFCPDEPKVEELSVGNDQEIRQLESPLDEIRRLLKD